MTGERIVPTSPPTALTHELAVGYDGDHLGRPWHVLVQQSDDVVVEPLAGHVPRESVHVVGDLPVGERVEQRLAGLEAALARRQEQGRLVLVVLGVPVGPVDQEDVDRVDVVDGRGPVQGALAAVVGRVYVRVRVYQVLDHTLGGESRRQDQGRRPVVHPGVQVGRAVAQQDLEDAHRVRGHGRVQRRSPRVVLRVGVRAGVEEPLRRVRPGVSALGAKKGDTIIEGNSGAYR
jgi:hypothetical protein